MCGYQETDEYDAGHIDCGHTDRDQERSMSNRVARRLGFSSKKAGERVIYTRIGQVEVLGPCSHYIGLTTDSKYSQQNGTGEPFKPILESIFLPTFAMVNVALRSCTQNHGETSEDKNQKRNNLENSGAIFEPAKPHTW